MRAMILAAGRGERMRPLTDTLPKPLLKVGDKSIIAWQIERLRDAGIRDIIINHAYLGQQIEDELGDGRRYQVKLNYSPEPEALETLGGVVQALRYLGDAPFLLVSGDIYTDYPYQNLESVANHIARDYPLRAAHLVLVPNPAFHAKGDMGLSGGNICLEAPFYTYANIGVYHPRLFSGLVRGEKIKLFPWMYRFLGQQRVSGELFEGDWSNIGTPADLAEVNRSGGHPPVAHHIDQPVAPT
jgi:MurNAc alpha-1-phosphate uridylyltransferase